jgi:hypothetical protein
MTGRFDPLARNLFWQEVPERFPRGTLLDFPDSGHVVLRHPCAQAVIAAFLASPSTWRTPACYDALKPPCSSPQVQR